MEVQDLRSTSYIEVNPKYVFLCGSESLFRIFSRETGQRVLDIRGSGSLGAWNFSIAPRPPKSNIPGSALVPQEILHRRTRSKIKTIDQFVAGVLYLNFYLPSHLIVTYTAHVSACGLHLAILLRTSKLIIIYNFERAIKENIPLTDISIEVQLGSPRCASRYLAFENGRIGVATVSTIYAVMISFSSKTHYRELEFSLWSPIFRRTSLLLVLTHRPLCPSSALPRFATERVSKESAACK